MFIKDRFKKIIGKIDLQRFHKKYFTVDVDGKTVEKKNTWLNQETYEKVKREVESWPEWKRKAYDDLISHS